MSSAYRQAGVDVQAGDAAVERLKPLAQATMRPEVLSGLGGFGGLFALDTQKYKEPVLVSGTDGVGTKLKLAFALDQHDTVGIDLVAMCVNDILVSGAEPLFFLDYLACGKLNPEAIETVVSGIASGCQQAGCALLGGETAEMPGMYAAGEYDLAGFAVGVVEKSRILTGANIHAGDLVLGLASSGVHSNGFSLVRKLLEDHHIAFTDRFPERERSVGDVLLEPTRIYSPLANQLNSEQLVKGWSHITGGGLVGNLPRVLPAHVDACIHLESWPQRQLFQWLQGLGNLPTAEMFEVFNMGIGLVAIIAPENLVRFEEICAESGESVYGLGEIDAGSGKVQLQGALR
jgi:phosphoribosylformylglycinamidine cyclo-ligase